MLVPNNPDIDVAKLLEVVRQELAHAPTLSAVQPAAPAPVALRSSFDKERLAAVATLIDTLQQRSVARNTLPDWVRQRFPLLRFGLVQRILLRLSNALLHDQRIATQATAEALRLLANEVATLQAAQDLQADALHRKVTAEVNAKVDPILRRFDDLKPSRAQASSAHHREASREPVLDAGRDDVGGLRSTKAN